MAGKVSKAFARYRKADRGSPRRCGNCVMFRPPGSCTKVAGKPGDQPIAPGAVCRFFSPKRST